MAVTENTNTAAAMAAANVAAREVDFVSQFNRDWGELLDVLGVTNPIRKQPGTTLTAVEAKVTLAENVAEGEVINPSKVEYEVAAKTDLTVEKYMTATTIEAVAKYGAELAVIKSDEAFRDELQSSVMEKFYAFAQTGTLTGSYETFQMAVSMAIGLVADKFKKLHRGVGEVIVFANTLDAYRYLGGANVTIQTLNGLQYIRDFLGARTIVLTSSIPEGKVVATPVSNIDLYYVDPGDSDFARLGLNFTVEGETNLIGFHAEGNYSRAVGESYALMGMSLFAEYLDGIAVVTIATDATNTSGEG